MCPPKNTFTNLNYDLMAVGNNFSGVAVRNEQWNKVLLDIEADLALGKEQIYVCGRNLWQSTPKQSVNISK